MITKHDRQDIYEVIFDKPLRGITPGQVAVFYVGQDGLICIGGGPIAHRGLTYFELGQDLPLVSKNQKKANSGLHPAGHLDRSVFTAWRQSSSSVAAVPTKTALCMAKIVIEQNKQQHLACLGVRLANELLAQSNRFKFLFSLFVVSWRHPSNTSRKNTNSRTFSR